MCEREGESVFVCVRERSMWEGGGERGVFERGTERLKKESVCVCERERDVCERWREGGRERTRESVCVCAREGERDEFV